MPRKTRLIASLLSIALAVQPAAFVEIAAAMPIDETAPTATRSSSPPHSADIDSEESRDSTTGSEPVKTNHAIVTAQLIKLGYGRDEASLLASQLTPADLEVLAANPDMMQRAGDLSQTTTAYIIGGLIIAGIVVLAANGSGFVSVN